jgi:APA family basic amino acid/polyamine antiporter
LRPSPETARTAAPRRGQLLRILGVGFGLAVIIGNTIGAGILRTPGEVAAHLPGVGLFMGVWVAGGLYALLGAVSIAELGTMIQRSGGQYVFAREALGEYAGFVVGWSDWLSTCGTSAAVSIVVGEYAGVLVPGLAGKTSIIAAAVVAAFAILQWRGVRSGSLTQQVSSLVKALAFVALIVACFALGGGGALAGTEPAPSSADSSFLLAVVLALQAVIYTYDGWTGAIYFSEEVRDADRNIPRAMFGGLLAVIAIYLLFNLAMLYVLPVSEIAGQTLAAGAAAQAIFGQHGDAILRSLTIVSMLSSVNANQLMATRVVFAMSRDGLFSSRLVAVNQGGTPAPALLVSTLVAMAFILSGTFEKVIALLAFFFVANYVISFTSVFVLRRREPERERPYKAWGYPWTTGLALACSVAFLTGAVASDTRNSLYSLALLGASYPAFHLLKRLSARRAG